MDPRGQADPLDKPSAEKEFVRRKFIFIPTINIIFFSVQRILTQSWNKDGNSHVEHPGAVNPLGDFLLHLLRDIPGALPLLRHGVLLLLLQLQKRSGTPHQLSITSAQAAAVRSN
jgi:hypothetical protein